MFPSWSTATRSCDSRPRFRRPVADAHKQRAGRGVLCIEGQPERLGRAPHQVRRYGAQRTQSSLRFHKSPASARFCACWLGSLLRHLS